MAVLLYILSVNIDSLGVGISYGLRKIHISFGASVVMCLFSVIYSGFALFFGSFMMHILPEWLGKTIGSMILLSLGFFIIIRAFIPPSPKPQKKPKQPIEIHPFGRTISIVRDPTACDFDSSNRIDPKEALYLGLVLSLDSIGVGIGAGLSGISTWFLPLFIGLAQLIFLTLGSILGSRLSHSTQVNSRIWTVSSGVLLIVLAVLRVFP